MNVLSLLLKILAAGAVLLAIVTFVLNVRGIRLKSIPQQYMMPLGLSLVLLAICFGAVDFLTSQRDSTTLPRDRDRMKQNDVNIVGPSVGGSVGGSIITGQSIRDVTIYQGDPPEVRQRKLERAKQMIAAEVIGNIEAIDARIGYVKVVTTSDEFNDIFDEELAKMRRKIAPAAEDVAASAYRRLIAEQRVGSLRHALNSSPLRAEFGEPLIAVLAEAGSDSDAIRMFYDQLAEVTRATESMLSELSDLTKEESHRDSIWKDHDVRSVHLAADTLQNRSEAAHVAGLYVLNTLAISRSQVSHRLVSLNYLCPQRLVDEATIKKLMSKNIRQLDDLLVRRKNLLRERQDLIRKEIDTHEDPTEIKPGDTWNEVVGKAISLRQLGRMTEALAAFDKYRQIFSSTDPTAEHYANTAQAFTQQLKSLGRTGGVYIYHVREEGTGAEAGLQVGDIIVVYNAKTITEMDDFVKAQDDSREGSTVRLTYLRLDPKTSRFTHHTVSIPGGPLGMGIMPI
jgi:hypothetical protein